MLQRRILMNKKQTFKRALAFIIDIFLITIISGMFAEIEFINPYIGEYENISEEYLSYVSEITDPTQIANDEKYNNSIIYAIGKDEIKKFHNIKEASQELNISRENIRRCLTGEYQTYENFVFMLAEELELRDENNAPVLNKRGNILLDQENYNRALKLLNLT